MATQKRSTKRGREALKLIMGAKPSLKREVESFERSIDDKLADRMQIVELERRCLTVEHDYNLLKQRLVNLLLPEQIDAAKTCGITPELYCLEWIDLIKDQLRKYTPARAGQIEPIYNLRG